MHHSNRPHADTLRRARRATASRRRKHERTRETLMGPCLSIALEAAGGAAGASGPANAGPYMMNSPDSRAWLTASKGFGRDGKDGFSSAIQLNGPSALINTGFGVDANKPAELRYYNKAEVKISKESLPLDGSSPDVSDGEFSIILATALPLEAPVGKIECHEYKGAAAARVKMVDLYVTVDGKEYTDGHVCCGEPTLSKKQAIDEAVKQYCYTYEEKALRNALNAGPPDGSKPWATLVSDKFRGEFFVHVPILGKDLDNTIIDPYSSAYGHSLMTKATKLFSAMGAGDHEVKIRVAPRGIIDVSDPSDGITLDAMGIYNYSDEKQMECPKFASSMSQLATQHITDPNASGMTATFNLNLSADQASGKGPVRTAQEFSTKWPAGEVEECIELAMKLANTGPCGAMAAKMAPGSKCCHIILVNGENNRAGIDEHVWGGSNPEKKNLDFHAWALFKSKDGKPDSEGAQIKFRCQKNLVVNYRPVSEDWKSVGFGMQATMVNGLAITNAEIDKAIARDAEYY